MLADSATPDTDARMHVLSRIPLFSCFTPEEQERLAELFVEISCRAGDTVCTEGEEGDTFFVLVTGELEVWGGHGEQRVITRIRPGEYVGEMALLLGGRRSATVTASRPSRLLVLNKAAFNRFFIGNPKVIEYFSKELCRRLASTTHGDVPARATTVIVVTALPELKGKTLVASVLAALLRDFSRRDTLRVRLQPFAIGGPPSLSPGQIARASQNEVTRALAPDVLETPVLTLAVGPGDADRLGAAVARLYDVFSYIVLEVADEPKPAQRAAEDLADVVVRIVSGPEPQAAAATSTRRSFQVVNLYNKCSAAVPINHCEPFVLPDDVDLHDLDADALERRAGGTGSRVAFPLRRLARKILGTTVGLALGGGAAFGIAHLGVLGVLEESDIEVDLVAGCSMGSVVACAYAAGFSAKELIAVAQRLGTKWNTVRALSDLTLTRPGLLSGSRMTEILAPLIGSVATFEELRVPCRTVATDIETGECVCIGEGRLDAAFRASSSVPMLWAPVSRDGRVLVDGGVCDPVPADVVRDMGADLCIAVNAVPKLKRGVQTVLSHLYRGLNPLSYFESGGQVPPSMFDVIMNSMQVLQHELGHFRAISADVRINLDLSGYTWIEFYRAKELIEHGAAAAERALPEIRRALAARLRAPEAPERTAAVA